MDLRHAGTSRARAAFPKIIVPISVLLSIALVLAFASLIWTAMRDDTRAESDERTRLGNAISAALDDMVFDLADVAASTDLAASMRSAMLRGRAAPAGHAGAPGFDTIFIVPSQEAAPATGLPATTGALTFDRLAPSLAPLIASVRARLAGDGRSAAERGPNTALSAVRGEARLLRLDDEALAAAVVPLPAEPARTAGATAADAGIVPVLAGVRRLDPTALAVIARAAEIDALDIASHTPVEAGRATYSAAANGDVSFSWRPRRPGAGLLATFGPLLMALAALFSGLIILYARRVTTTLAKSEEEAWRVARHDQLCGIPNRLLFVELLDAEIRRAGEAGHKLAALFVDLDRFKDVNDAFGHEAGDRMIKAIAERIANVLHEGDTLARVGGDEFAILQKNVGSARDCEALARRVLQAVQETFAVGPREIKAALSIGVAMYPQHAATREELLRAADLALYRAKDEGRNRFAFFDERMGDDLRIRKTIEEELRTAIQTDALVLHYQPVLAADGKQIVGVEALVRWRHNERGLIPPDAFIRLAEDRGLILPLGEWVLRRACRDGLRWPTLKVAVNVSPIQFLHKGFVGLVGRILQETGFDPSRLELELTEGVVVDEADEAESAIIELRAMGVRLALDDFGTGYSSLIYLRRFAFDKIKIDKSFLESMESTGESAIIVHSAVHLGRALGLTVTAEGVETPEQHRFLQAVGCHELQGFLFSRPVPADDIDRLLGACTEIEQRAIA
ncbi:MAG: EAL domain-containing protein [Methylobacteriaceae bacterium]|nr:EAL domain-containing protein [Methylobacteriaceae bacterium]